jgi:UDP-glucose 4-epimerase
LTIVGKLFINNKIAVVGANGFIGSNLVDYFSKKYEVVAFSSKKLGYTTNQKVKFVNSKKFNLKNLEQIKTLKCNRFVYSVSMNHIDTNKNLSNTINVNIKKFIDFCDIVKKINKKNIVIYLSTFQIYGDLTNEKIITEKTPVNNQNLYALTHYFCEEYLKQQEDKNFNGVSLRLSNVFGYPLSKKSNAWWLVLNSFCKTIIKKGQLTIESDGKSYRDFIYIDDLSKLILKVIKNPYKLPKLLNVSSGNCMSIKQAAYLIKKICKNRLNKKCEIKVLNNSITTKNNRYFKVKISRLVKLKKKKTFSNNIEHFLKKIILLNA